MERLVGVTLVALGVFVIVSTIRQGQSTRMPSRGALLVAGFRRLRRRLPPRSSSSTSTTIPWGSTTTTSSSPSARSANRRHPAAQPPTPARRRAPDDPLPAYGGGAAVGVGMIHGIGFETPTQALVFVTAAGAGSRAAGLLVLACFLAGLLAANTVVALASTFG